MQFVPHGPELPERLLQAHEEGRVVFFCGAGISFPAGLKGFDGLTCKLFNRLGLKPNPAQASALQKGRYDEALNLLERDFGGGRRGLRRKLLDVLQPDLSRPKATTTHLALLTLARTRHGKFHLVTTNFDRLFEQVIQDQRPQRRFDPPPRRFSAPTLPSPTEDWSGLVYLHGRLPDSKNSSEAERDQALDDLVLTSSDFGRAYLTEGWAARFVAELFRRYTVCFVGYSLHDPLLRYMTDAVAADRLLDEQTPEVFAFDRASPGKESVTRSHWEQKQITPILYQEHPLLHRTLHVWASIHRHGTDGKQRLVARYAAKLPAGSTPQDDFAGRVLWALSDPSGKPAQRFARHEPVPPIEWLGEFCKERFGKDDLPRFGVFTGPKKARHRGHAGRDFQFSLLQRPAPFDRALPMALVTQKSSASAWDPVMCHVADWLLRHLNNPKLLCWLAGQGGQLHPSFASKINQRLNEIGRWERANHTTELDRLRSASPDAIPSRPLRKFWRLMLAGRVRNPDLPPPGYWWPSLLNDWLERLVLEGATPSLRLELIELLRPCLRLGEPSFGPYWNLSGPIPLDWNFVHPAGRHAVENPLAILTENQAWKAALPDLLKDFERLTLEILELSKELGRADDCLHWKPSLREIFEHDYGSWAYLIYLLWEAWLALAQRSPEQALHTAQAWWGHEYSVFKRLALTPAVLPDGGPGIPTAQALDWLLADEARWLWKEATEREVVVWLQTRGPQLNLEQRARLEVAILNGPPATPEAQTRDWAIYLRLYWLTGAGKCGSDQARQTLKDLAQAHPEYPFDAKNFTTSLAERIAPTHVWGTQPSFFTPRRRRELVEYILKYPKSNRAGDWLRYDDWWQRCKNHFPTVACALWDLARRGVWPSERWGIALDTWSNDEARACRAWRWLAPTVAAMPDDVLQELARPVAKWLRRVAKTFRHHEDRFFSLIKHTFKLKRGEHPPEGNFFSIALNHPVGLITEALLDWLGRRSPAQGEGLPAELRDLFTDLCLGQAPAYQFGRYVLASRLAFLFWLDETWTAQHLLPWFDWSSQPDEALRAWSGFLTAPRLNRPLLEQLKPHFLATATHYPKLELRAKNYAALLTVVSLELGEVFAESELAEATQLLPIAAREHMAWMLVQLLASVGDRRAEYCRNRVLPYLRSKIWPKSRADFTPKIRDQLARLCVAAGEAIPEAFQEIKDWLEPLEHPYAVTSDLKESGLCPRHPQEALEFLSRVVAPPLPSGSDCSLAACLEQIVQAAPNLRHDPRYLNLERAAPAK